MLVDQPEWLRHEGKVPIMSIDVDWEGKRVATSGSDNRVRVWNLGPILQASNEKDPSQPRLLATMSDHISSVNVARFSPKPRHALASGSDDGMVIVFQLSPGPGRSALGSKEPPSVENWAKVQLLKGHSSNVLDLTWCPDGTKLASCSIDNTIRVWNLTNGHVLHTLEGHHGHVKGVAWDPFEHYLASQGEQDGVFIWSTATWQLVHKVQESPLMEPANAMHARLHWSPDGQTLCAVKAYSKPLHQALLIQRNKWDAPHQLCGHKNTVLAARYNPHVFYDEKDDEVLRSVCALGSADRQFTVWTATQGRPVYIGTQMFDGSVMDVAWTPDGSSLLAASYDGTVAVVMFAEEELGRRAPDSVVQQLYESLYGPQTARGQVLPSDASLLVLQQELQQQQQSMAVEVDAAAHISHQPTVPVKAQPAGSQHDNAAKRRITPQPVGVAASLDARLGPGGHTLQPPAAPATGAAAAAAAGRKRVAPIPTGQATSAQPPVAGICGIRPADGGPAPAKRLAPQPIQPPISGGTYQQAGQPLHAGPPTPAPVVVAAAPASVLTVTAPANALSICLGKREFDMGYDEVVEVEARNNQRDQQGRPMAVVKCTASGRLLWQDTMSGSVVALTGTLHFSAVGLANGELLVLSPAGRRLMPPICLGSSAAHMAHNGEWMLLLLTADGWVKLWDVQNSKRLLNVSITSVLASTHAQVTALEVAPTGAPIVVLSNHQTLTYHADYQEWVRIADAMYPASVYHSTFAGASGDLARLQARALQGRSHHDVLAAAMQRPELNVQNTRAHLESSLAAALALGSATDWRRWLIAYVRHLVAHADEVRLQEVISDLLGPVHWTPNTHANLKERQLGVPGGYCPTIFGNLEKRDILKNDVLPELARSQSSEMQRLAQQTHEQWQRAKEVWSHKQPAAGSKQARRTLTTNGAAQPDARLDHSTVPIEG